MRSGGDSGWPFSLAVLISELMVAKSVDCPPTVPQYCCLTVLRPPKTTVLEPSCLFIVIWSGLVKNTVRETTRGKRETYREQGAGRGATTIANDSNLRGVEQSLGRGIDGEGLALLAQLLTEEILVVVDDFPNGVLKPVVAFWEEGVVSKRPVEGVIQHLPIGIHAVSDSGGDGLRKRFSTSLRVEASLGFRSTLGSGDDTMEPVGDANVSATIVGNVNDQLFGTSRLEVLQTCEQVLLEISERGGAETAKSQNTGLSFVQVVELGDRVTSAQWWQGGDKFRRENNVGRGSGIEEDIEMVLAGLIWGDLGLLLNTGSARLDGSRRVVVDTIGAAGGPAVPITERGTIGPRDSRRGKAGTEWDLKWEA